MFRFEAKFLRKKAFVTQGGKFVYRYSAHAERIMDGSETNPDGSPKWHTNGEVTKQIIQDSLSREIFINKPSENKGADATFLSLGIADAGMWTHAPGDKRRQERTPGSLFPIEFPIALLPGGGVFVKTVFPIENFNYKKALADDGFSLSEWVKIYEAKTGLKWPVSSSERADETQRLDEEKAERICQLEEVAKKNEAAVEKKESELIRDLQRKILSAESKLKNLSPTSTKRSEQEENRKKCKKQLEAIEEARAYRLKEKSKKSCLKSSKTWYNSVSEGHMKLAAGSMREGTMEEVKQSMVKSGMTIEEVEAYWEKLEASCEGMYAPE